MMVRGPEGADFQGWVTLDHPRYDEVLTNKELGVYTHGARRSPAEEATLFGS